MAQRLKPTEYGGGDTEKTKGIHPPPHVPTPAEKLRLIYDTESDDPTSLPTADGINPVEI